MLLPLVNFWIIQNPTNIVPLPVFVNWVDHIAKQLLIKSIIDGARFAYSNITTTCKSEYLELVQTGCLYLVLIR